MQVNYLYYNNAKRLVLKAELINGFAKKNKKKRKKKIENIRSLQ